MKYLALALFALFFTQFSQAAEALKIEGTCTGTTSDGVTVGITYYSDFDGCKAKSKAAISFTQGQEGLYTGQRKFVGNSDLYNFGQTTLRFANSTGNTSGVLKLLNPATGAKESVQLTCEVRDYEYMDC